MVWPGKGEACRKVGLTAQVGTKKRTLRSNQETDEGKLRRPGQLLDKENPIQGPWCRFRREARARERHRHCSGGGSLKVLDPKWPIREADSGRTSGLVRLVPILLLKSVEGFREQ